MSARRDDVPVVGLMRGVGPEITDADDAFLRIVGYSRADLDHGTIDWQAMTPPEFLHLDEAGIRQAETSGGFTAPYQKEFVRKDGARVPVLLVCAFIPDRPGEWMGYVVDLSVSEPLRADPVVAEAPLGEPTSHDFLWRLIGELVRERTRILAMMDHTDVLLWAVDRDYRLLSSNQVFDDAIVALRGHRYDVGSVLIAGHDDEITAQWTAWYDRAFAGEQFVARSWGPSPSGREVLYESTLTPMRHPERGVVGVTVVSQDVTARDHAERALRESELRFRSLATSSPLGIFYTDETGALTFANPRLAAMWHRTEDEMTGRGCLLDVHPDDLDRVETEWSAAIRDGRALETGYRLVLGDGGRRHVHLWLEPLRDRDRVVGFVGGVDDETERRALADRLRQSEKMEALGTLAGGIAHDFNNMLGVVLGFAELALADADAGDRDDLHEHLDQIRTASLRARDLVRQILAFSRRTEQERVTCDLRDVVEESTRLLRATLPAAIELHVDLGDDEVPVRCDATAMQQVVLNLCTNAEHAIRTAGAGRIDVITRRSTSGTHAVLTVRDTGHGMAADVVDRLFEPFFTTKPVGEGTGMGLAVVHGIVTGHGGTVTVESAPGEGATFVVVLPIAETAEAPAADEVDAARAAGRVLLAEDEPALRRFIAEALVRAGFELTVAVDGTDALERFAAAPESFDVVVSDVSMPGLPGDRLAEQLVARRPDLPIVLMTGYSATVSAAEHVPGVRAVLHKPIGMAELVRVVTEALGDRRYPPRP